MDTRVTDDPIRRDFRRYQLTIRLIAHQARTQTIHDLTGYTRHQLATLRRRWRVSQDTRHRGPPPTSFALFFHSPEARHEGAALAVLCHVFDIVSCIPKGRHFPAVDLGERVCEIFEAYRACFPRSALEFEQAKLLAMGLAEGELVELGNCVSCSSAILIDRLAAGRRTCSHCRQNAINISPAGSGSSEDPGADSDRHDADDDAVQVSLF